MLILSAEQFLLQQQTMFDLATPEGRAALDVIIEAQQPNLIVLDSVSTLVRTGFENEAESWAPIQPWLMQHRWQGRSIILIHHEGRSNKPRGTTKREDVLDTIIGLKHREPKPDEVPSETESSYELVFTKYRHFFGPDAAPLVLHLGMTSGRVAWRHESVRTSNEAKVRQMLSEGVKQSEIVKTLKLSKGWISRIAKKARLEGEPEAETKEERGGLNDDEEEV
jgi:putative DNA primase/helicase